MPVLTTMRERNCGTRKSCWKAVIFDLRMRKGKPWKELGLTTLDRKNTKALGLDKTGLEDLREEAN